MPTDNNSKPKLKCQTLVQILKELEAGVIEEYDISASIYTYKNLGYCHECRTLSLIAGNYDRHVGRDCDGDHYEPVETTKTCQECRRSDKYVLVSVYHKEVLELKPEKLVAGINKRAYLMSAEKRKIWQSMSRDDKIQQVMDWYALINEKEELEGKLNSLNGALT